MHQRQLIPLLGVQWLAPLAVVGGIVLLAGAGIVYKEDIKALLHAFIRVVDRCGPRSTSSTSPECHGPAPLQSPSIGPCIASMPGTDVVVQLLRHLCSPSVDGRVCRMTLMRFLERNTQTASNAARICNVRPL